MKIMKFGGTSMWSAKYIVDNVAVIIEKEIKKNNNSPIVVVSAMTGITNKLLTAAESVIKRQDISEQIEFILNHHLDTIDQSIKNEEIKNNAKKYIQSEIHKLNIFLNAIKVIGELTVRSHDIVVAVGEKLSAKILSSVLLDKNIASKYVNLEELLTGVIDYDSNKCWDIVERLLKKRLSKIDKNTVPVLTGFFGPTKKGILHSVWRGYSDFTASIAGAAMNSEEIQIWTDVDWVLSANPKIVENAFILNSVSFNEMAELSRFGAKVLHPNSVTPAVKRNIPIRILNTFNFSAMWTIVSQKEHCTELPFKSITYKKNNKIIRVESSKILLHHGFVKAISILFAKHKISIDLMASSEISISFSVDEEYKNIPELIKDLEQIWKVFLEEGQTIISIIGVEMRKNCCGKIFTSLSEKKISVNMISMWNLKINLSLIIDDKNCEKAVQILHKTFFKENFCNEGSTICHYLK